MKEKEKLKKKQRNILRKSGKQVELENKVRK